MAQECDGFEADYFGFLSKLEARNFWFKSRNKLIIWAIRKYFWYSASFLEIGCGTGFVISGIEKAFPTWEVQGSEVFTRGLEFASQRLRKGELFQMDARAIPFHEEFDVIGAFDVLEHISEDVHVLSELYRAAKHGIILTVPQHPWLWSQADEYAHHVRRYRAIELKQKVESAGFKLLRMSSFVSILLPLMLISRLRQRGSHEDFDPTSELDISSRLNLVLESALTVERQFIKRGICFPWGGSLLLVAQKR
jgi:SAM-dependent methyltransferase